MNFRLVIDAKAGIAETPVWDRRIGQLYWTNVAEGSIHRYDPITKTERTWHTKRTIGSAVPCTDQNKIFCALDGGLFLFDLVENRLDMICNPDERPEYRYNDSRIDARGRIFTSSVSKLYGSDAYRSDMQGNFYMVDTDGTIAVITEGVNQYNGIVWNGGNTEMYVVDTFNGKLLVFPYDIDRGPIGAPEREIDLSNIGMPDGISIDEDDNLYICHWTGEISVWNKQLDLKETIAFPVKYACCGGFGGMDMREFYVASSSYNYTNADFAENPGAGGLFAASMKTAGRPDNFYPVK